MEETMQSIQTTESPFVLTDKGVFFRDENGWGIEWTKKGNDIGTAIAIRDTLNKAWREGFSEGAFDAFNIASK